MILGEFINQIAQRTGYNADSLKAVTENASLAQVQLPDDFVSSFKQGLLTVNEAKINPELKKHFAGVHLGSVDATINELIEEYGFGDDVKNTLKGEQSTFERLKLSFKSLADLKDQASKAVGGEKAKLIEEHQRLEQQILAERESAKKRILENDSIWQGKFANKLMDSHYMGYEYAIDGVDPKVAAMTARNLVETRLAEKGGKIKFADDNITLVSNTDEALPFSIDHKPVSFKDFTDSVLAEAKLLKVKGAPAPVPTRGAPTPTPPNTIPVVAPAAKSASSRALEDLRKGSQ